MPSALVIALLPLFGPHEEHLACSESSAFITEGSVLCPMELSKYSKIMGVTG